jgi:hypothetical protein
LTAITSTINLTDEVTGMTTSPTIREFQETVRSAFEYLGREFAFQEVEPPAAQLEANPFLIWFANAVTLVQVEGINHGFAAQVILGRAGAGGEWHATVPLWAIIRHRRPDLYDDVFKSPGQLGEIRVYARALREAASDVLKGDFQVFAAARAIIEAQAGHQRLSEQEATREYYHRVAAASAAEAFRAKDFTRVVELLLPHAERLTPAERAKLAYARTHTEGTRSSPARPNESPRPK